MKQGAKGDANRFGLVDKVLEYRQNQFQQLDRQIKSLEALQGEVDISRSTRFPRYSDKLKTDNPAAGLGDEASGRFRVDFAGKVDELLSSSLTEARKLAAGIVGSGSAEEAVPSLDSLSEEQLKSRTIADLTADKLRLQKLIGLDERRTKQLTNANQRAADLRSGRRSEFAWLCAPPTR